MATTTVGKVIVSAKIENLFDLECTVLSGSRFKGAIALSKSLSSPIIALP